MNIIDTLQPLKTALDQSNIEQSEKYIKLVTEAFAMIENNDFTDFAEIMHQDIKIFKNNDEWNYQQILEYGATAANHFAKITINPLELVLVNGNYVTAKYTEHLDARDGSKEAIKFISIFEIKNQQIFRVTELAVPST